MHFSADLSTWFLVIIIYSFVGWVFELVIDIIFYHKVVNRGFLIGPICPIYGVGAALLTISLGGLHNVVAIFLLSIILSAILEYSTSYIMEKIFHVRWWDYSHEFGNLHGRICLRALICFGVMGVIILKITNPLLFSFLASIDPGIRHIIAIIVLAVLATDLGTSLWLIIKCRVAVGTIRADATDEITANIREVLLSKGKLNRRLAKAFPNMKVGSKTRKTSKAKRHPNPTKSIAKRHSTTKASKSSKKSK